LPKILKTDIKKILTFVSIKPYLPMSTELTDKLVTTINASQRMGCISQGQLRM